MEMRTLGESKLRVSRLCYGSLTLSPLQHNYSLNQSSSLLLKALESGVNFIDTAEIYQNYFQINAALALHPYPVVIATKAYAYTREQAKFSLKKAQEELNREVIDIFLLHEQESSQTLQGHLPALEYWNECKEQGTIRAVGISTHYVSAVKAASHMKEVQVIHPLINLSSMGIRDGSAEDMMLALDEARNRGKGIYIMKPLAGGHLKERAKEALSFIRDEVPADAVALGMGTAEEIDYAVHFFSNQSVPEEIQDKITRKPRKLLHLPEECTTCRKCVESCPQGALSWNTAGPVVDHESCFFCGYCGAACPQFCWRII